MVGSPFVLVVCDAEVSLVASARVALDIARVVLPLYWAPRSARLAPSSRRTTWHASTSGGGIASKLVKLLEVEAPEPSTTVHVTE